ncbi:hypothetical protein [Cohnella silvisoli]|uniref:Lipoprotein n=1 Tax=Cohnella silvisoli TaxID=2873699 RepID=A0ABV1L382_9BACL|nr:hypothetical protein [Cohnella silvisoli]MCD9026051.1 hypothetical protein [Cohnella silvisoli]
MINKRLALLIFLLFVFVLVGCVAENNDSETSTQPAATVGVKQIIDANEYFRISEKELVALKGKPELKDSWNFDSSNGKKYKAITYTYDDGNQEYLVIDSKVVRFTYYANDQLYTTDENLFKQFGILPSDEMKKSSGGTTIKFNSVSEKVPEVWVTEADNKIDTIKITYDLRYF